jgi:catabolite repression HPr-like protein
MGMMTLGLSAGEKVVVTAKGADEEQAVQHIEDYLSAKK